YSLQRLRHVKDPFAGVRRDGYLGIYFRCGGLNSSRFSGKGQEAETWAAVFSYYTDLWLGGLTVDLIADLRNPLPNAEDSASARAFVDAVIGLFDVDISLPLEEEDPVKDLSRAFQKIQRDLDRAINNAALTHDLQVRIGA